jgi:hypothetical protein
MPRTSEYGAALAPSRVCQRGPRFIVSVYRWLDLKEGEALLRRSVDVFQPCE